MYSHWNIYFKMFTDHIYTFDFLVYRLRVLLRNQTQSATCLKWKRALKWLPTRSFGAVSAIRRLQRIRFQSVRPTRGPEWREILLVSAHPLVQLSRTLVKANHWGQDHRRFETLNWSVEMVRRICFSGVMFQQVLHIRADLIVIVPLMKVSNLQGR